MSKKLPHKWTRDECHELSLKYTCKRDFYKDNVNAYTYAYKHKFLDEICSHMIKLGGRYDKCVYVYEFPDNSAYIGITNDMVRRQNDRNCRNFDTVTRYKNENNLIPILKQLTNYINVEDAIALEEEFVNKYKKLGWKVLNKIKTGGIGGEILYWTKERCLEECKKHKSKSEFNMKSKGAYNSARKHGWIPEIYNHLQ